MWCLLLCCLYYDQQNDWYKEDNQQCIYINHISWQQVTMPRQLFFWLRSSEQCFIGEHTLYLPFLIRHSINSFLYILYSHYCSITQNNPWTVKDKPIFMTEQTFYWYRLFRPVKCTPKLRKFATNMFSRQNSVNQYFCDFWLVYLMYLALG